MRVFIKEWPNKTATLITETGKVIWTFSSAEAAHTASREWYNISAATHIRDSGDGVDGVDGIASPA